MCVVSEKQPFYRRSPPGEDLWRSVAADKGTRVLVCLHIYKQLPKGRAADFEEKFGRLKRCEQKRFVESHFKDSLGKV